MGIPIRLPLLKIRLYGDTVPLILRHNDNNIIRILYAYCIHVIHGNVRECTCTCTMQATMASSPRVTFEIGESFHSYSDLEAKVKSYEKSRSIQLTHRDSRTLEAASKRVPKRVEGAKPELKYYNIHLTCLFGGKKYKNKGSGERTHYK